MAIDHVAGSDATQESGEPATLTILAPNILLFHCDSSTPLDPLMSQHESRCLLILANRSLWHQIYLHTPKTLGPMREACVLARNVLDLCCSMAAPGVTTDAIDAAAHKAIVEAGACPSPLNYNGFPKVISRLTCPHYPCPSSIRSTSDLCAARITDSPHTLLSLMKGDNERERPPWCL